MLCLPQLVPVWAGKADRGLVTMSWEHGCDQKNMSWPCHAANSAIPALNRCPGSLESYRLKGPHALIKPLHTHWERC